MNEIIVQSDKYQLEYEGKITKKLSLSEKIDQWDEETIDNKELLNHLRSLDLPNGNEALFEAVAGKRVREEKRHLLRRVSSISSTLQGIRDPKVALEELVEPDRDLNVDKLVYILGGKDEEDVLIAMKVIMEKIDAQKSELDKMALLKFIERKIYLYTACEDFFKKKPELAKWRAEVLEGFNLRGMQNFTRRLLGKVSQVLHFPNEELPYIFDVKKALLMKFSDVQMKAVQQYLSGAKNLMDFANRYTFLVFGDCLPDTLDWQMEFQIKSLMADNNVLSQHDRIKSEIKGWFSEDMHYLLRRLASGKYDELNPEDMDRIFKSLVNPEGSPYR